MDSERLSTDDPQICTVLPKLSHKKWRALQKKLKRKARRKVIAIERENNETLDDEESSDIAPESEDSQISQAHQAWLERERRAMAEINAKKLWEEKERQRREEDDRKIKEEWEERQRLEKEEEEERKAEEEAKKKKHQKLLKEATANENTEGDWHNPIAPPVTAGGKVQERPHCPFFAKVGACRFGDRCSRFHDMPDSSQTLLFPNMYCQFQLDQGLFDEYDSDLILEYEDTEIYHHFKEFYVDVLPEFRSAGQVVQLKVCCNYEPHLRGNVYVQYASVEEATRAFIALNGRWYAGKQLSCEFSNITKWKNAICGLYHQKRCPKGKNCNFLHVFRNPGNEFREADFDFENSQRQTKDQRHRQSYSERSERYRRTRSRSPSQRRSRTPRHNKSRSRSRDRHSRSRRSCSRSTERSYRSSSRRSRSRSPSSRRSIRDKSRDQEIHRRSKSRDRTRRKMHKKEADKKTVDASESIVTEYEDCMCKTPTREELGSTPDTDDEIVNTTKVLPKTAPLASKRRRDGSSSDDSEESEEVLRNKLLGQIMNKENGGKSHKSKKKKHKKHKHKKHKSRDVDLPADENT